MQVLLVSDNLMKIPKCVWFHSKLNQNHKRSGAGDAGGAAGKDLKDLTVLQGLAEHERQNNVSARPWAHFGTERQIYLYII